MTTPTHIAVNLGAFLVLMQVPGLEPTHTDLALILVANLIDLDHLLSPPIYVPTRNSFKTHLLHKPWKFVLGLCVVSLFIRPIMFQGIGVILHYFLEHLDNKRRKIV